MTNEELFLSGNFELLYSQNEGLMHHICKKYLNLGIPYEDLVGCGDLAFMKAIKQFDPTQAKWLTYYGRILHNEILMLNRKQQRWNNSISLQKVITEDIDGHVLTVEDTLSYEEDLCKRVIAKDMLEAIKRLSKLQQQVLLLTLEGNNQKGIGVRLGFSQSYVSRILQASRKQLLMGA